MPRPNLPAHAGHDLDLIAAHAAGDTGSPERLLAERQLATCPDCRDLHGDLIALATATRSLPPPVARRRDFRLDPAQGHRLRRRGWLRELLRPFAAPRSAVRPMAAAFTSLGVVGLLVATVLPALFGVPASAPARDSNAGAAAATSAPAPVSGKGATSSEVPQAAVASSGPAASSGYDTGTTAAESGPPATPGGGQPAPESQSSPAVPAGQPSDAAGGPTSGGVGSNLLLAGSAVLLGFGLVLFGLRAAARRIR